MIHRHCSYFCCCTCFGIKNINVTTKFDQIHQLFHKILSINIILKSIKGHNSVEKFGKIMCISHNMDHMSSHLSPLTLEVVEAPQMTLQQYLSILPCLPLPSGNLQTPFPSIPLCYLPVSSSVFLSFFFLSLSLAELSLPCQRILRCGHTIWVSVSLPRLGDHHVLQLHSGFCWEPPCSSHGLCRKCSEVSYSISSQELGSFSLLSLYFCCQGPALTGIKEGR